MKQPPPTFFSPSERDSSSKPLPPFLPTVSRTKPHQKPPPAQAAQLQSPACLLPSFLCQLPATTLLLPFCSTTTHKPLCLRSLSASSHPDLASTNSAQSLAPQACPHTCPISSSCLRPQQRPIRCKDSSFVPHLSPRQSQGRQDQPLFSLPPRACNKSASTPCSPVRSSPPELRATGASTILCFPQPCQCCPRHNTALAVTEKQAIALSMLQHPCCNPPTVGRFQQSAFSGFPISLMIRPLILRA